MRLENRLLGDRRDILSVNREQPGHAGGKSHIRAVGRRGGSRNIYGALDLGTNNCRLLIAKPVHGNFKVIDAFSRIVRLGEGVKREGRISDAASDRALAALKICADKLRNRGVTLHRAVATEACRAADNVSEFLERAFDQTGIHLDVIGANEEARLAVLGCRPLLSSDFPSAVVFDIGGGSTEVTLVATNGGEPQIEGWISMPVGVVSLADEVDAEAITLEQYDAIRGQVAAAIEGFAVRHRIAERINRGEVQLVGSSGTVTTLASLALGLQHYDRSRVDGCVLDTDELRALTREIAFVDHAARVAMPCIGAERAGLVVPGCAIFEGILEVLPVPTVTIGDRGIREGILRSLMARDPLVNATPRRNGRGA